MNMIMSRGELRQDQQDCTPSVQSSISSPTNQSNTHRSDYMSVFKKINALNDEDEGNAYLSESQ